MRISHCLLPLLATASITCPAFADTDYSKSCPQVYLDYDAGSSSVYTARYAELVVQQSASGTYFCANAFSNNGFLGIQELPTPYADGTANRVIVFSAWGSKDYGNNKVPDADKAQLVARGDNVCTSQTGASSTGGQSYLAYDWKVGDTIRTLVVEKADGAGFHQIAGYFYNPGTKKWQLLSCWRVATSTSGLSRGYGFIEDLRQDTLSPTQERKALFGSVLQWNGTKWETPALLTFTKDSNPASNVSLGIDSKTGLLAMATGGSASLTASYPLNTPFICDTLPKVVMPDGVDALVKAPAGKATEFKTNGVWEPTGPVNWAKDQYSSSFANGVELRLTDKAAGTINHAWSITPTQIVFNNSTGHNYTVSSKSVPYIGDTRIIKKGTGLVTIANGNGYKGGTLIYAGTLKAAAQWALGSGGVIMYGGTLDLGSVWQGNTINVNTASSAVINGGGKFWGTLYLTKGTLSGQPIYLDLQKSAVLRSGTIKNKLIGNGRVVKDTTGTVNMGGVSTYVGGTTIKAGKLVAQTATALGTGDVTMTGGTFDMGGKTVANLVNVNATSAVIKNASAYKGTLLLTKGTLSGDAIRVLANKNAFLKTGSVKNVLTGTGIVVKEGSGTAYLFGKNTHTGGTLIKAGTLSAKTATALGKGSVSMTGGTLLLNSQAVANTINVNAKSAIIKGTSAFKGSLVLTKGTISGDRIPLQADKDAYLMNGSVKNALSGKGWVVKDTAGTVYLFGSNSYTGGTLIKAGILSAKTATAFGKSDITMSGGTLLMNSLPFTNLVNINAKSAVIKGTSAYKGTLILSKGTLSGDKITIQANKDAYLKSGSLKNILAGKGWVVKDTTGAVYLYGKNTYTGGTLIRGGTLSAKTATALGKGDVSLVGGTLHMNSLALSNTVNVNGTSAAVKGSSAFKGTLVLSKGTLSGDKINLTSGKDAYLMSGTIKNPLTGTGFVCKYDPGTVTLAGANNWTGNTYVQGGTLVLSGPTSLRGTTYTYKDAKLDIRRSATFGNLFLAGGALSLKAGSTVTVTGTLSLANPTTLELNGVTGSTPVVIAYKKLDNLSQLALNKFFGLTNAYKLTNKGGKLTIIKPGAKAAELPVDVYAAPLSVLGQSTWGTARAARLFDHTVRDHAQAQSVALDKNRSVWFAGMSGFSHVDDASDTNIYGGAVGMQFNGSMGGNAGIAIGQTYGHISPAGATRVKQQTQHAALYGTKMLYTSASDSVSLTGTASYGTTDSDHETLDWTQHSAVLGVRGTWEHKLDKATAVYGFAGLEYLATGSESGSGSIQALQGSIGAGISHTEGRLTLHADASFTPDMVRNAPSSTVNPGRLGFEVGAGATYRLNDKWSIDAGYTYHNEKRADSHEAYIGARCTF